MPDPAPAVHRASRQADAGRQVLVSRRPMLDPFLRAAVGRMPPTVGRVAAYHLGWLDESGRPVKADSGKAIRSAMVLLASEAVGGTAEAALPAAGAIELVHNFSLIHDDVIDRDRTRRHRPTAWCVFGIGPALSASHALLALAFDVLAASGRRAAPGVATMLSEAVLSLLEGQSEDLSFERRSDVSVSECFGMAERKTALLMSCACAAGATFGGGRPAQVDSLRRVGRHLGLAFQLVDDLLGIWGDPAVTGKPVWSDLQCRKKTLPVVAAVNSGTAAGRALAALYQRDAPLSKQDLARAADLIEEAGGREWSNSQVEMLVSRALDDLESAEAAEAPAAELRSLAHLISARDR